MDKTVLEQAQDDMAEMVVRMKRLTEFIATDAYFEQGDQIIPLCRVQIEHGYYELLATSERVFRLKKQAEAAAAWE